MSLNGYSISTLFKNLMHFPHFKDISIASVVKTLDFFSDLDDETLNEISPSIQFYECSKGEIICHDGKFDEKFYIILSGSVKAVIPTEDNPKFELYTLNQGDFFGEEVVFTAMPRENTVISVENLFALSVDCDALKKMIKKSDKIRALIDKKYIERKLKNDLRRVPLFTNLDGRLFEEVLTKVEVIAFPEKYIVFKEGDEGDSFFLIRNGEVKVYRTMDNKEKMIAILSEGEFFGEAALMSNDKRNASVETLENTDLVKITRKDFTDIIMKNRGMMDVISRVMSDRIIHHENALKNPDLPYITRKLIDLNRDINRHLNIISQCTIDTEKGSALLATLPGSRYPYVYPRDSACASRFLYTLSTSELRAGEIAFRLLGEISRFILNCQRGDGYWGQRYGIGSEDKGIYKQEDNVAHGVSILCRYLLAAKKKGIHISNLEKYIAAIDRGAKFAIKNYYRNEIHLFYSTTSIHESAIEEGYSIWVNYAYLMMFRLIKIVVKEYGFHERFDRELALKKSFETTIDNVFTLSGRYVRRLRPDGVVDLRPDITLMSPFFFGTGYDEDYFDNNEYFTKSIEFIEDTLWDPDLGMLQRYLPFIEDPDTHIHAGNGPWIQYTAMLAQYYFYLGNIGRGDEIISVIDKYKSKEGHLCEHLTTPERFYEFYRLEWEPGRDYDKEFNPHILIPGMPYGNVVEEISHMNKSYKNVEEQCKLVGEGGYITFARPLMWSHAEYAMALLMKTKSELKLRKK